MRLDNVGRVEHLLKEIQQAEKTEDPGKRLTWHIRRELEDIAQNNANASWKRDHGISTCPVKCGIFLPIQCEKREGRVRECRGAMQRKL